MKKEKISFYAEKETIAKLDKIAKESGSNRSELINDAVIRFIEDPEVTKQKNLKIIQHITKLNYLATSIEEKSIREPLLRELGDLQCLM